jgi:nucleoside-diphosphate-sugar epimerase
VSTFLVTGAEGFIGRSLVRRLESAGGTVIGVDLRQGDIADPATFHRYDATQVDHVFHLAGKTFVPESWNAPFDFYRVNVLGTVNVLDFCRRSGAALTYVSSYLYGHPSVLPVDEDHPVQSYNPYSHTKILAESSCSFYAAHFGVKTTLVRPFNAYGPGQSVRFLIPGIIEQVLDPAVETVEVMDLIPARDYVYVDDLAEALARTQERPGGIYNIGSGRSVTVGELIALVMRISGITKPFGSKGQSRPNEVLDLYAGIARAARELGWQPATTLEEGIRRCIDSRREQTGGPV